MSRLYIDRNLQALANELAKFELMGKDENGYYP